MKPGNVIKVSGKVQNGVDDVTYGGDIATTTGGALADIVEEDRSHALRGAQILADALKHEGVDVLFGYPGGANLEIFDVLPEAGIRCVRTEHEQGAAHAAEGYARSSGKVGVCLATSGPGATNLVTGIADANSDSVPIVAITGNVPTHLLGKNAFQEVDIVGIVAPITKKCTLVRHVFDIPSIVREAFALALGNRPGPVLIDVPKDVQQQYPRTPSGRYAKPQIPAIIDPPQPSVGAINETQLDECRRLINESRHLVIYAGGGVVSSGSSAHLVRLAEKLGSPVTTTLMGLGLIPPGHPLNLGPLGMHGAYAANVAVNEADLVLALGVRFDDRVTGRVREFIRHGKIIHIDMDGRELNKNKTVTLPICADLQMALPQLIDVVEPATRSEWIEYLKMLHERHPLEPDECGRLSGPQAIRLLSDMTGGDAIVTLGVGQHQMWAMQHYKVRRPRSFISSSGFGTMGFGLPAAIGAKVACPDRQVIDIDGDGSLNMTIHELATCRRHGIGVKIVVINNQWLGMVRQWQDMIYGGHRAQSSNSDPRFSVGEDDGDSGVYPDFLTIAAGYRVKAERSVTLQDLETTYSRMLADPAEPYLVDVLVRREENVYPMIPAGATYRDVILSADDLKRRSDASTK